MDLKALDQDIESDKWLTKLQDLPYFSGYFLSAAIVFITYVLLAEWSYTFVLPPNKAAIFWLPSGISAAIFVRARWHIKLWPLWLLALFTGELYVALSHDVPLVTAIIWSFVNFILPLSFVYWSRRFDVGRFDFRRLRDVFIFMAMVPLSVIPGALIAGAGSMLGFHASYFKSVWTWGASDSLGIILAAPVILSWTSEKPRITGRLKEGIILFTMLFILTGAVWKFSDRNALDLSYYSFLIFFVAWASIRFGARGTSLGLLIIDLVGVLVLKESNDIFNLQLLVANIGFLMLALAAAIEEQKAAREAAERALKMRDDFISIAAHELKTPLSSLMLQVQMLNHYIDNGKIHSMGDEKLFHLADISNKQVKRFSHLINDLLDVSRINTGKLKLHLEQVNVNDVIASSISHFQAELEKHGCQVSFDSHGKIIGKWDRMRLEQVFTNLISNAIKYGAGKPISFEVHKQESNVIITVHDQGMGIAKEDQDKIFERFVRAVPLDHVGGLGLGLFITKQIVEAHGGSIKVESDKGKGANFILELPLQFPETLNTIQ